MISPPILTIADLNDAVARSLERSFPLCWVTGEISNATRAASGHWYFTLKDQRASVRAVMFKRRVDACDCLPKEGEKVEACVTVTLYTPRGDYQLNVETLRRAGAGGRLGQLYEAFLRRKDQLTAEGLFQADTKRPIPLFSRCIGIVSSPQAAALRDVITTLQRRAPHVQLVLYPTPVQGQGAAEKIAQAIHTASHRGDCDVLIVCRGGGSIEDLWSFNEDIVVRAIVAANMPVIVGVGHETDITLADFAADLRAATPTAAAECATQARSFWVDSVKRQAEHLMRAWQRRRSLMSQTVDDLSRRLVSPRATKLRQQQHVIAQAARLRLAMRYHLQAKQHDLTRMRGQLDLLNPQQTLSRGYAVLTDMDGSVLRAPTQLHAHQTLHVRLAEGTATVTIDSVVI